MVHFLARGLDALFSSTSLVATTTVTTWHYPRPANYPDLLTAFNAAAGTSYTPDEPLRKTDPTLSLEQRAQLESFIAQLLNSVPEDPIETETDQELRQSSFRVYTDENIIRLEDRDLQIPRLIRERPPLMLSDKPNYLSFPQYADMDLTISYRCLKTKFASINGRILRARDKISNRTRADVLAMHQQNMGIIEADPAVSVAKIDLTEFGLVFAIHPDYLYFEITRPSGSLMVITVPNKDQTKTDRQSIILAYAFARAAIYSYCLNAEPIDVIEADFAALIVTLILSIRTGA